MNKAQKEGVIVTVLMIAAVFAFLFTVVPLIKFIA